MQREFILSGRFIKRPIKKKIYDLLNNLDYVYIVDDIDKVFNSIEKKFLIKINKIGPTNISTIFIKKEDLMNDQIDIIKQKSKFDNELYNYFKNKNA